ncbi:DUF4160 domain-containing protein [Candidatus Gracilibacteria bacterium]|nr:DUF4160 domain-containing protein [Candidatus Gracilibacteria bacterium]
MFTIAMDSDFGRVRNLDESLRLLEIFLSQENTEAFLKEEENIFGKSEDFIIEKKHLVGMIPDSKIKVEIFSCEEGVPHFRVKIAEFTAKYDIKNCNLIEGELPNQYRKKVLYWYRKGPNKQLLIDIWNQTRPDGCQVGKYK